MTHLAPVVGAITQRLIGLLDEAMPGQLEAFYLVGSVAQGDYQDGQSDVDFIAVLAEPVNLVALTAAHADLAHAFPGLDCDGIYLRPGELSQPPAGEGVAARAGKLNPQSDEERHPVVWMLLADNGIALRGRAPDANWIAVDRAAAILHSRANLQSYWRPWLETRRRLVSTNGASLLTDDAIVWAILGVARVHATIAAGRVPSKSAAAAHALLAFPEHTRIIAEALRLRTDPTVPAGYRSPLSRRRDLIAFMDVVIRSGD
jgi:hypothetical protein